MAHIKTVSASARVEPVITTERHTGVAPTLSKNYNFFRVGFRLMQMKVGLVPFLSK